MQPDLKQTPGRDVTGTIYATNPDVMYIPFVDEERGMAGYCARNISTGAEMFVYLVPSQDTDDGTPNVFVYSGEEGDPVVDGTECHVSFPDLKSPRRAYRVGVIERYERTYTIEARDELEACRIAATKSPHDEGDLFEYHSTGPMADWNVTPVEDG